MMRSSLPDHIEPKFNGAAKKPQKRTPPVSIRFSDTQRSELEVRAKGQPLGPYIRNYVLDGHGFERKKRGQNPIKDHQALARVLRALGKSELGTYLCALHQLTNDGQFIADADTIEGLRKACTDITSLRNDLISALGLREGNQR